jgi:predicted nucleotidyltransferase component of viral defense system
VKRLEAHEVFEMTVLQHLKTTGLLPSLAFGGGTMLRLCHELPRYSLDVDFWFYKDLDFNEFYSRLEAFARREYDVTDIQNEFHSMVVEIRRRVGMPRLKIEIRKVLAPPGTTEEKIAFSPHFPTQVLVRGFTLAQMFRNKVLALLDRGEVRDAFDLEFLTRSGVAVELDPDEKKKVLQRLGEFKKRDFGVKLGSVLLPDMRDYYREKRFAYLEEKLSFDKWV